MWYSFPCIRIPDTIARKFVEWISTGDTQTRYHAHIAANKYIDVLFQEYVKSDPEIGIVLNMTPNLVNHVDHLIGGSVINNDRAKQYYQILATYWEDPKDRIDSLERSLKNDRT